MTTIYDYSDYFNIYVIGETNVAAPLLNKGAYQDYPTNSLIIMLGCYMLNNENKESVVKAFENLNKFFATRNTHLFILRGSHENPSFFNGETFLSNIHTLEDYSVLKTGKHNTLCIGGAIPFDRYWLRQHGKVYNNTFVYDEDKINEIFNEIKIDSVITQTVPSKDFFIWNTASLEYWKENDETLVEDYHECANAIEKLYNILKSNVKLEFWITTNVRGGTRCSLEDNVVIMQFGVNDYEDYKIDDMCKEKRTPKTDWRKMKPMSTVSFSVRYQNPPQIIISEPEEAAVQLDETILADVDAQLEAQSEAQAEAPIEIDQDLAELIYQEPIEELVRHEAIRPRILLADDEADDHTIPF